MRLLFTTFAALVIVAGYGAVIWVDNRLRAPLEGGDRQRHGRSSHPVSLALPHPNLPKERTGA